MNKLNLFIILFLIPATLCLAAVNIDLSEHGEGLMKAPFAARYRFESRYHKDWKNSSYLERKAFLTDWHTSLLEEQKKQSIKNKEEEAVQKEKQRIKNEDIKKERFRLKAKQQLERREAKDYKLRNKGLDKKVTQQQKTLDQLQKSKH